MKIKTITCHDVYNVGASLQAYALAGYLKSLGHDTEIIDYKPDYLRHFTLFGSVSEKYDYPILRQAFYLAKLPGRIKAKHGPRKKEYDLFTEKYLPVTKKTYCSNIELKQDPPIADVFFAGSDQIWNTVFPNGKDPAFYLDFVSDSAVKASYAASFSTEKIEDNYEKKIKERLTKFDYISVRERSGVKIVRELGLDATQVLDPVFLLNKDDWLQIEKDLNLDQPYILYYDFDNNDQMREFTVRLAKKNNCKIFSIFPSDIADSCFAHEGPASFLYLVRNAQMIVSNSFHATAFSLIFKKQFYVFNRKESINTRMLDLLKSVGLSDRLIVCDDINDDQKICYQEVDKKLSEQINHSKKFIDVVLESVNFQHEKDSICY